MLKTKSGHIALSGASTSIEFAITAPLTANRYPYGQLVPIPTYEFKRIAPSDCLNQPLPGKVIFVPSGADNDVVVKPADVVIPPLTVRILVGLSETPTVANFAHIDHPIPI